MCFSLEKGRWPRGPWEEPRPQRGVCSNANINIDEHKKSAKKSVKIKRQGKKRKAWKIKGRSKETKTERWRDRKKIVGRKRRKGRQGRRDSRR
jgi:hypothetical protein